MEDRHIGSLISVYCNDHSLYQGKLTAVDGKTKNITIANAFREGVPLGKCVTLSASEIDTLKVLKAPPNQTASSSSSSSQKPTNIEKTRSSPKKKQPSAVDRLFEAHKAAAASKKLPEKVDISATPHYKSFEPQVPHPTVLESVTNGKGYNAKGGCNKKQGPSGIPLLDALNHYKGHRHKQRNNLDAPIDFDLDSDFDFDGNLKLFEKEQQDDDYYENVEKLKCSKNFAHYENIVEDEDRVISWTSVKSTWSSDVSPIKEVSPMKRSKFSLSSISYEKSKNGQPIPAVSAEQKREFLKECSNVMGETVYDTITADRLFEWICDIQMRFGDNNGSIVLIASAKNSVRFIRRILTHLDKRSFNCHLFGKYPGEEFENVQVVDNIKLLPDSAIVCLLSSEINEDVENWLRARPTLISTTHFVCVESVPQILPPSRVHLLMYGCATSGLRHVKYQLLTGKTNFEQLCSSSPTQVSVDTAIADIGSPANWFDDLSKRFISVAFSTSFLIHLSSSSS